MLGGGFAGGGRVGTGGAPHWALGRAGAAGGLGCLVGEWWSATVVRSGESRGRQVAPGAGHDCVSMVRTGSAMR